MGRSQSGTRPRGSGQGKLQCHQEDSGLTHPCPYPALWGYLPEASVTQGTVWTAMPFPEEAKSPRAHRHQLLVARSSPAPRLPGSGRRCRERSTVLRVQAAVGLQSVSA